MDPRERVRNKSGTKSSIKQVIEEIITEIETRHGVTSFPMEEGQDEHKLDQNSENITENPVSFQNLLEGRVSKVELLLAAFKRQEEERRIELEREQLERERRNDRWRQEDRETLMYLLGANDNLQRKVDSHDVRLAEQDSRVTELEGQVSSMRIGFDSLENQISALELGRMDDQEDSDPDNFGVDTGLSTAAPGRRGGVTLRPGQAIAEERTQKVKALEKQLSLLSDSHGEHMKILATHGGQISRMLGDIHALAERVAHHAGRITQSENDILAMGSRDAAMDPLRGVHSDIVIDDEKSDEPLAEAKPAIVRSRRELTGTNPPESTFSWTDMRGDIHYEEVKHCDREVQTVLPNPPAFAMAEPRVVSPKSRKFEKKVGGRTRSSGGGGDGFDSDDDGDKRRRSEDEDSEPDRARRKKKGLTRDYLKSVSRTPLLASPAKLMALMAETPAARRAHPMPYYGYGPMPLGYGGGPYGFPTQITMRERPTIDKLCLSRLDVPRLLIFREKFVRLQQSSYPDQLLITHYLDSRVMAMLVTTIKTEDKFEDLWEQIKIFGGVVQAEHQLLDNNDVYSVLTFIARPKSKLEMDTWLGQSVWDATSYGKFKNNRTYIQTYMDYYLHAWTHYKERFEILIEILCHDDTMKYFPVFVKKKNGVLGLIDYFVNGTPDVGFTKQINDKYITAERYEQIQDFPTFVDEHFRGLKKLRDHNKLV